jgi:CRP/FNR family cyclic AMP-dependent transcriptional regulator
MMKVDISSFNWQQVPLFNEMPDGDINRFVSSGFRFQYEAGSQLVSNCDPGETFFLILRGMAKLGLVNSRKEPVNVTLFVPGDFFGEMAMLDPVSIRSGDIQAITDLEVMTIHKKEFLKMTQECSQLSFNLARNMAHRLRMMNERLVTDTLPDPLRKVAYTLLMLSAKGKRHPVDNSHILMPPLSLLDWSLFCYTSIEVFRASLDMLKRANVVDVISHQLIITDFVSLERIAKVNTENEEADELL